MFSFIYCTFSSCKSNTTAIALRKILETRTGFLVKKKKNKTTKTRSEDEKDDSQREEESEKEAVKDVLLCLFLCNLCGLNNK